LSKTNKPTVLPPSKRQKGWVKVEGADPTYVGYWHEYCMVNGIKKRMERCKTLGKCTDISEEFARRLLLGYIQRNHAKSENLHALSQVPDTRPTFQTQRLAEAIALNRGSVGELLVAVDLLSKGCEVFQSMSHGSRIDLMAYLNGRFSRIQVKVADMTANGTYSRNLRLKQGDYDILAVVSRDFSKITYAEGSHLLEVA
jgi:hypothetical protein